MREAVRMQEAVGLHAVTDGELRRDWWHLDFLAGFDGITVSGDTFGMAFSGGESVPAEAVTAKITAHDGRMREHFAYLASVTTRTPKLSIPSPTMVHLRGGRAAVDAGAYPDLEELWADLTAAYRAEIAALGTLGCTYLQLDDVSFAYLCDADLRDKVRARGDDPNALVSTYARAVAAAVEGRAAGMTVTTHVCRGNFQSTWMAQGGYEPVAERMFADLDVDAYFMEYDTERAGGFEPLRFVPEGKRVVLGLVTSKAPELEDPDLLIRRIGEAAKYVDPERLCLSPQCGFSSAHHGNALTEDDQWRKLELVVQVAERVWA